MKILGVSVNTLPTGVMETLYTAPRDHSCVVTHREKGGGLVVNSPGDVTAESPTLRVFDLRTTAV